MKLWQPKILWNGFKKSVKFLLIVFGCFIVTISIEKHFRVNQPESWFRPSNRLNWMMEIVEWLTRAIGKRFAILFELLFNGGRLAQIMAFIFGFFPAMEDVGNILWPLLSMVTSIRFIPYSYFEYFMIISKEHYIVSTVVVCIGIALVSYFYGSKIWKHLKYWMNRIFKRGSKG